MLESGLFKFKIDSSRWAFKMRRDIVNLVSKGINTDPFNFEDYNVTIEKSQSKLKRHEVQHLHISNSGILHESYQFGEVLGQGSFGTVLSIDDKIDNKTWAMKIIPKTLLTSKMKIINREIQILKIVTHPHVIFLSKIFESNDRMYLVLEKCTGELGKIFKNSKPFSESDTRTIITQLAEVVHYLHKNDIVHRDLKLENILLARNPENPEDCLYIKVTDFGLSIIKGTFQEMLHERCGTLTYLSPEIITNDSYSHQCDIWSMGVIMYLLLTAEFPFYALLEEDLIDSICYEEPNYSISNLNEAGHHLLQKMLRKDPAQRITAAEIKMHAWIKDAPLDERKHKNVFEMMEMWRSDMRLPQGTDCDWVTTKLETNKIEKEDEEPSLKTERRQSLKIPIHNIQFDGTRKGKNRKEASSRGTPRTSDGGKRLNPAPYKERTRNGDVRNS